MNRRVREYLSAERQSPSTTMIVSLTIAATVVLLLLMNIRVGPYDESLVLEGAVEVGAGLVPHRDFFWTYGPLQLWIISGLFSVFGKTFIVARLYDIVVRAFIVLLCGLTARRFGARTGLVAGVMVAETVLLYATGFFLYPVFPSVMCALAGTLLLVDEGADGNPSSGSLAGAGILTGLTALFRYDIGFFLLVGQVMTLSMFCFDTRRPVRVLIWQIIRYGLGVAIAFLPVAIAAWVIGAIPAFFHDILTFPSHNYAYMRSLPWPRPGVTVDSLLPLVVYIPFLTAAAGLVWLVRTGPRFFATTGPATGRKLAIALLFLTIMFVLKGLVRVSLVHSVLALVPALLLLAYLLSRKASDVIWLPTFVIVIFSCLLILLNALLAYLQEARGGFHDLFALRVVMSAPMITQNGQCSDPPMLAPGLVDDDTKEAGCYIRSHTKPTDPIFVGAGRHDKIFAGNASLYFVSDRMPATHWYHLEPGLQTRSDVQHSIIEDLEKRRVNLIAIDRRFDNMDEPNGSAQSSRVQDLDRFIRTQYDIVAQFGDIAVMARRPNALNR